MSAYTAADLDKRATDAEPIPLHSPALFAARELVLVGVDKLWQRVAHHHDCVFGCIMIKPNCTEPVHRPNSWVFAS